MWRERMKGNLDLLLLAALIAAPGHGYELGARLRQRSDGAFNLPEGSIYPALHRLEARGLVTSSWVAAGGRRRRVYTLTGRGQRQLAAQRREWATFTAAMRAVLGTEIA
jgi:DNA-binding PadR family transcriptional regulator